MWCITDLVHGGGKLTHYEAAGALLGEHRVGLFMKKIMLHSVTTMFLRSAVIIASLLSLLPLSAFGRVQGDRTLLVSGVVTDASSAPLQYVTVALADTSGTVLAGTVTDSLGRYALNLSGSGIRLADCRALFSFVGYREKTCAASELVGSRSGNVVEFLTVSLEEDSEMLEGAKVSGERPLIEHQFDRLVLNVSELAVAQTGDAMDVLKSSPGVTVDQDGNIKLNGSTVAVWIDGRPSNMSGTDLEAYLKGSDGSSIEKVELITNPSSKYDAEGSGGIINIKTRKGFMRGFSGTLGARYRMRFGPKTTYGGNLSANLMYRTDRTNTFFQYTPSYDQWAYAAQEMKLYGTDNSFRQESMSGSRSTYMSHTIRLGNDWHISSKDIFGVIFRTSLSDDDDGYYRPNSVRDISGAGTAAEALYSELEGNLSSESSSRDYSLNLNYTRTFDESKSQELTLNADYYRSQNGNSSMQRNIYTYVSDAALSSAEPPVNFGFDDSMRRILDLYSFKADYSQSFWNQTGRLEAGAKLAISNTRNSYGKYAYDFAAQASGELTESNDFTYNEQVYAAYVNVAKKFSDKWNAQLGVRGEYTVQTGDWLKSSEGSRTSYKDYFDIFPSAFVSWTPSQKVILTANYSYRISRPKYWQLNPFRQYASAFSYSQGDIELEPSYNHNVSLTAVLFSRLSLTAGYSMTRNFNDVQTPIMDENGVMGLLYMNAGNQQNVFAGASLSELPLTKWWNLTANVYYYHQDFQAYPSIATDSFGGSFSNDGDSFMAYLSTTFFLPKDFRLGMDGFVATPQSIGYFDVRAMWSVNLSLNKTFMDDRGILSFYLNDLFNSASSDLEMTNGGVVTYRIMQEQSTRGFSIGFTWRFGKGGSQQQRRNVGTLDEESRL